MSEQLTVDREAVALRGQRLREQPSERAARADLRAQVARLEAELSQLVAGAFPHMRPDGALVEDGEDRGEHGRRRARRGGGARQAAPVRVETAAPRLLSLAELERMRDTLAGRVREAQHAAAERARFEAQARALLARMRLEPGHYKFVRLPVANLGEGGCGVWQVRPRLGLIGMLAGWWELKLSSGCP